MKRYRLEYKNGTKEVRAMDIHEALTLSKEYMIEQYIIHAHISCMTKGKWVRLFYINSKYGNAMSIDNSQTIII